MKVICINSKGWWSDITKSTTLGPSYGEISEVIGLDDKGWYFLEEYESEDGYEPRVFIPLSDIDERDIAEQRELELVQVNHIHQ